MSDEDLDDLLDEVESESSDDSENSSPSDDDNDDDGASGDYQVTESEIEETQVEEEIMTSDEDEPITQAEVYENLKRIGELEDEKQKIQDELRERTEQLRSMLKHVDRNSILYKMLQSALADSAAKAAASKTGKKPASKAPKAPAKKAAKKKGRR